MPRLTELQIQAMRPAIVGVPEHKVITFGYPNLRRSRTKTKADQTPDDLGMGGALPIDARGAAGATRLWPFILGNQTALIRNTVVSQRYNGPAVIERLVAFFTITGGIPAPTLALFVAEDPGGEGSFATQNPPPSGASIFDSTISNSGGGFNLGSHEGPGFIAGTLNTAPQIWELGYRVLLQSFFLKVSSVVSAGASFNVWGYIRIAEGLPVAPVEVI